MVKKTIEYDSFEGKKLVDTFYFNLTPVEVAELNEEIPGGIDHFKDVLNDNPELIVVMKLFKTLIGKAVARKQGDRIIKPSTLADEFVATEAYSNLFFELWSDANKMTDFLNGLVPAAARARVDMAQTAPKEEPAAIEAKPAESNA